MFGVGATLKRAQAVEFSKPYLVTNIYAVTRKGGKIKAWADIDKKGVKAAVSLGSYIEVVHEGLPEERRDGRRSRRRTRARPSSWRSASTSS